jgi:2-keto-4-pentenoate hydratase/2-oxohepta-3-ene-1,7-dioic acid hydratase in catechol pathway
MKIARFRVNGQVQFGIVDGETVSPAVGHLFSGLAAGATPIALNEVELLAPVEPGKVVCVGLNYAAHVTERDPNRKLPTEPVIFMKPTSAIVGPNAPIALAYPDHVNHHEAELVVFIGKTTDASVMPANALGYVLGYTAGNDVSDRTLQAKDGQWIRAKGFRSYCPLGPWIETELDLTNALVQSRVNGEIRQSQTTAGLMWPVPELISYLSGIMTLNPGDVIMTGTPEGVGPLVDGDLCEIEIGGIGVLSNPVVSADSRPYQAPPPKTA